MRLKTITHGKAIEGLAQQKRAKKMAAQGTVPLMTSPVAGLSPELPPDGRPRPEHLGEGAARMGGALPSW